MIKKLLLALILTGTGFYCLNSYAYHYKPHGYQQGTRIHYYQPHRERVWNRWIPARTYVVVRPGPYFYDHRVRVYRHW